MYIYKERTGPWLWFFRIVFTLAVIGTICYIFYNSSQAGEISGNRSKEVTQFYNQKVAEPLGLPQLTEYLVRKAAHITEYAVEGFFLMLCLRVYTSHCLRYISWPILIGGLTALCDETYQRFIPGRSGQIADVWVDSFGLFIGTCVALVVLLIIQLVKIQLYGVEKTRFNSVEEILKYEGYPLEENEE